MTPLNYDDVFSKKLDQIMDKVEIESNKTRDVLVLEGRVSVVEQSDERLQREFDALSKIVNNRMANVSKAMLDPSVYRDAAWRAYWREQLELL